jgi:hypothetical protein
LHLSALGIQYRPDGVFARIIGPGDRAVLIATCPKCEPDLNDLGNFVTEFADGLGSTSMYIEILGIR